MWVYSYFAGDDVELAFRQHDIYKEALHAMRLQLEAHVLASCAILDLSTADLSSAEYEIDHRSLQVAHDILAAAWRWQVSPAQRDLFLKPQRDMLDWLYWLRVEIASWQPSLVSALRRIVVFNNQPCGYAAEDELRVGLLNKFDQIAWSSETAKRRQR